MCVYMKYTVINLILDFDASTFPNLDMNYAQHTLATANVVIVQMHVTRFVN